MRSMAFLRIAPCTLATAICTLAIGCTNSFNREANMTLSPQTVAVEEPTQIAVTFDRYVFDTPWDVGEVYLATDVRGNGRVELENTVGLLRVFRDGPEPERPVLDSGPNAVIAAELDVDVVTATVDVEIPAEHAGATLQLVISSEYFDVHGTQRHYAIAELAVTD